jgi:hypothetical protein
MPTYGGDVLVGWVERREAVTQAADQGVKRLV